MAETTMVIALSGPPANLTVLREYLAGIECLAREAGQSPDPRVVMDALAVLERQPATIRALLEKKD